jgi:hypothetical protein
MTIQLIETKTIGTAVASVAFTSIPQDGTDLMLLCSTRASGSPISQLNMQFNSSGGTSYADRTLEGTGSGASSSLRSSQPLIRITGNPGTAATADSFSNVQIYIPNYTSSVAKSVSLDGVTENNATLAYQSIVAGLWNNTAAITSITFTDQNSGNFVAGCMFSLYKITKGSDGIVTTSTS